MQQIDNEKFGKFITELRKEKNLTQKELADQLFVSDKTVSKWERGNDASNIEYWTNAYIDDLFESTVIIGDSIQHGFFVLVCDGSNDGVYYYDDSYSLSSSDDENNVYFIANTFDEFFTLLYN